MDNTPAREATAADKDQAQAAEYELVELVTDMIERGFSMAAILAGTGSGISAVLTRREGPRGFVLAARWHGQLAVFNQALALSNGARG